jgi:hypothetical protein
MDLSVESVQFFAEIRKVIPRSAIGVQGVFKCYADADKLLKKTNRKIKGKEVLHTLNQYGVKPHQSTVTRWFKHLGGYRKDKEYSPSELKKVFTSAFIYKAQLSTKLPEAN